MKLFYSLLILIVTLFVYSCGGSSSDKCSKDAPNGSCDNGKTCVQGVCISKSEKCSSQYPNGYCEGDYTCQSGVCVSNNACSETVPNGTCENSSEFCDNGTCKPVITKYKIGAISQVIDENHNLTDVYHFDIMDTNGRHKHRITNDVQSCINKDSCWISPNYKYFLYLIDAGNDNYSLKIVDIPDDFQTNFASSEIVTAKLIGQPYFLNDGKSFIYIEKIGETQMIKKYNMENKSASDIAKFSVVKQGKDKDGNPIDYDHPAVNFTISPDNKTMVFDIMMDYRVENNPSEIWKLDITQKDATPILIYKFNKFNQDGNGMNWGVISQDNKTLAFISAAGLQHRLHIVNMDGSSLDESGGDPVGKGEGNPLGKFIGPDYNSCGNIEGTQICDMKSELYFSKDNKFLYFAGKVGKYTDMSPMINIYKYDIANKNLIQVTDANTDLKDQPFQSVAFNMETGNVIYTIEQHGYFKNFEAWYLDLNSTQADLGKKEITQTRELRELKLFFLKQ